MQPINAITKEEALQQLDASMQILVLVTGTLPDGSAHYAYAAIPPSKYQPFKEAEAKGNYDLGKFGQILAHGAGTPSEEVRQQMEKEHGVNHVFEDDFKEMLLLIEQRMKNISN